MWRYLKLHESFVREALRDQPPPAALAELKAFHLRQVRNMQHERLIHLVVTMFVATFFLLGLGFITLHASWTGLALVLLLLVLLAAYLLHYFRLENGVQRWYHLANQIDARLGLNSARYEGGRVTKNAPNDGPGGDGERPQP